MGKPLRISHHPLLGEMNKKVISFTYNGEMLQGLEGEPIAVALLANHIRVLRRHEESGSARGLYCGIGHCMECRVQLIGKGQVRACLTPLQEGMEIREGSRLPNEITGRVDS
ncbi:sarcosine oxidase subunit alpha [Thermoactinomyces sp. DSM 45891]|nr:sarcosine oxidase subunit alpha [Thermoactinomyces sp. DSM 45891]